MGKIQVSVVKPIELSPTLFVLLTFPLSHSVNYHIKASDVSWEFIARQWCVVGLSVLAHTYTPPVESFTLMWVGKTGRLESSNLSHPHVESRSLLLTHRSGLFHHAESRGNRFSAFIIFLWMNHSCYGLIVCIFHTDFVVLCICPPV